MPPTMRLLADNVVEPAIGPAAHLTPVRIVIAGSRVEILASLLTLAFRDDGALKLRVPDLEPALGGQLDASAQELLVAGDGHRAPLLRAELQRGENVLAPVGVVDLDCVTPAS
jgi:hypothetical protein